MTSLPDRRLACGGSLRHASLVADRRRPPQRGVREPGGTCDVFVYRDGHWHATYSQHTTASG